MKIKFHGKHCVRSETHLIGNFPPFYSLFRSQYEVRCFLIFAFSCKKIFHRMKNHVTSCEIPEVVRCRSKYSHQSLTTKPNERMNEGSMESIHINFKRKCQQSKRKIISFPVVSTSLNKRNYKIFIEMLKLFFFIQKKTKQEMIRK